MIVGFDGMPVNRKELRRPQMMVLGAMEDILADSGLTLVCQTCLLAGHKSRAVIRGANAPGASVYHVVCECTTREFHVSRH